MAQMVDCFYWNPDIRFETKLSFTTEEISKGLLLRKPVFTIEALQKIIDRIKTARQEYLRTHDIPAVLDTIDTVNALWRNPAYHGRKTAREVLPAVTGFSIEMIESWGFDFFFDILKKENLPLAGKRQAQDYTVFRHVVMV